jgi:hypothetical protein
VSIVNEAPDSQFFLGIIVLEFYLILAAFLPKGKFFTGIFIHTSGHMPHSHCSIMENLKFLSKILDTKITGLKQIFNQYFCLISAFVIMA